MSGGLKFDSEKPKMDLLCPFAMDELSKVLTFGAKKYDSWNWAKGIKTMRLIAAALRHIFAYARGEDLDPETGLHHIAHAMCCCMFIIGMPHYVDDQDDRLLRNSTKGDNDENQQDLFTQNPSAKSEGAFERLTKGNQFVKYKRTYCGFCGELDGDHSFTCIGKRTLPSV